MPVCDMITPSFEFFRFFCVFTFYINSILIFNLIITTLNISNLSFIYFYFYIILPLEAGPHRLAAPRLSVTRASCTAASSAGQAWPHGCGPALPVGTPPPGIVHTAWAVAQAVRV